jgi:hypothetical protein
VEEEEEEASKKASMGERKINKYFCAVPIFLPLRNS